MKIIFGTDGWRGLIDKEINPTAIQLAAQAFADFLKIENKSSAAVGYDGRMYSRVFAQLFSEVLSGNGIKVWLSNKIIPTPVLSFTVKNLNLDAGVMITASHNPANYNGVKFKADYGGPFLTEETLKVEKLISKNPIKKSSVNIEVVDFMPVYFAQLKNKIDTDSIRSANLKILIDSMGGAGSEYLQTFLSSFGISSTTVYGEPSDDFYGRNAEPIEKNLVPLKDKLNDDGYWSLGIATDGDADRLGVLLDNGKWLSSQMTILLLTDFLIKQKKYKGDIVKTSSVTDKLRSNFETAGRKVHDVQVGFKYICEEMIKREVAFGCEESGGYGFGGHIPERDGLLSALMLIEMLAQSKFKKLSEYVKTKQKEFGEIFYDRIDFEYTQTDRNEILPQLFNFPPNSIAGFKVKGVDKFFSSRGIINGLKFYLEGNSRWLLMRSSETEPLVRIYSEGQSEEEVSTILNNGLKLINKN